MAATVTKTILKKQVIYTARLDDGRVATYTIEKSRAGLIEFAIRIEGDLRTWAEFCAAIDAEEG